ncbi:MAG: DUF4115 domain-containing protein [Candidatus Saccharibacteria bacterium]|nr:DUF4115 domain-containing protein [Rhodoferax sp.]
MTENPISSGVSASSNQTGTKTAGSILRAAREREGLHVAALAVSMKVPVKKLEALESDRLDLLPDAVFVRALAASVCRALKLDSTAVLALLPSSHPPKLVLDGRGINTPFDTSRHSGTVSITDVLAKPSFVIVGLLLVAAIGVYFYPEAVHEAKSVNSKYEQGEASSQVTETAIFSAVQAVSAPAVSTGPNPGAMPSDAGSLKMAVPVLNSIPIATIPKAAQAASGASLSMLMPNVPADSSVSGSIVSFKANGAAWVQVTDAKGSQLISKTLSAGEVVGISGTLPLAVIVGRSDLTAVEVRGMRFDLSSVSQNNVARFEIKQ